MKRLQLTSYSVVSISKLFFQIRTKKGCPLLLLLLHRVWEVLVDKSGQKMKEKASDLERKNETTLLSDDMF